MIPVFILMFSAMSLVQFFLSYCRSLLTACATVEISAATRDIIGQPTEINGSQFDRLMGLVRIASHRSDDRWELAIVKLYYRAVEATRMIAAPLAPTAQEWVARESTRCAYFAAAALDRRIASITAN